MRSGGWLLALLLVGCGEVRVAPVEDRSVMVAPAPAATPSVAAGQQHVVAAGDTLYGVAFRHGLDYRQLAAWNAVPPPYVIRAGQTLRLTPPQGGARAPAAGTASTFAAPERTAPANARPLPSAPAAAPRAAAPAAGPARPPPAAAASQPVATRPPSSPSAAQPGAARTPAATPAASPPAPAAAPRVAFRGPVRNAEGVRWNWPTDGALSGRYTPGDPQRQGLDIRGKGGQSVVAAADGEVVYSGAGLIGYGELIIVKHDARFLSAYAHNRKRLVAEGERVGAGQPIAEMGRSGAAIDMLHFEIRRDGRPVDPLNYLPQR